MFLKIVQKFRRQQKMRRILAPLAALLCFCFAACHNDVKSAAFLIYLSDVGDTTCSQMSMLAGRPKDQETRCGMIDSELRSQVITSFASEAVCHDISIVIPESQVKSVPKYYLDVYVWSGPDAQAKPEWQWSMNGAKFTGKGSTCQQMVRDICSVVKQRGARVD